MKAKSSDDIGTNVTDKGKGKRNWGSAFYTFLSSGGIILVLLFGFGLAIGISLLFYRK